MSGLRCERGCRCQSIGSIPADWLPNRLAHMWLCLIQRNSNAVEGKWMRVLLLDQGRRIGALAEAVIERASAGAKSIPAFPVPVTPIRAYLKDHRGSNQLGCSSGSSPPSTISINRGKHKFSGRLPREGRSSSTTPAVRSFAAALNRYDRDGPPGATDHLDGAKTGARRSS